MPSIQSIFTPTDAIACLGKCVVIFDILRASTTIVTAVSNGCRSIRIIGEVDEARELGGKMPDALLGGERGGVRPSGFDLGNSPFEYTTEKVAGKDIIFTTSNGTRAALAAKEAELILIGCFLNRTVVAEKIIQSSLDVLLLCAGSEGAYSFEDALCAGFYADYLTAHGNYTSTDDGILLLDIVVSNIKSRISKHGDFLEEILLKGNHARRLAELGFEKDVRFAAQLDTSPVIPVCRRNIITNL